MIAVQIIRDLNARSGVFNCGDVAMSNTLSNMNGMAHPHKYLKKLYRGCSAKAIDGEASLRCAVTE